MCWYQSWLNCLITADQLLIESSGQIQEKQFGIGWLKIWRKILLEKDALMQQLIMRFSFENSVPYYTQQKVRLSAIHARVALSVRLALLA